MSKPHLLISSPQTSLPGIPIAMTTRHTYVEQSLRDSTTVDTHLLLAGPQDMTNLKGGEKNGGVPTNPLPIGNGDIDNDYDDPEPSQSIVSPQSQNGVVHYYSMPNTGGDVGPISPPVGPYYSMPNAGGDVGPISPPVGPYYSMPADSTVPNITEIYDIPDCDSAVPSSNDPVDSYDKIIVKDKVRIEQCYYNMFSVLYTSYSM